MSVNNLRHLVPPDAEFCWPVQGLFADLEAGTGVVCLTSDFQDANPIVQLRVLKGWAEHLAKYHALAIQQLFQTFGNDDLPHEERLAKFARHCAWSGLEVAPSVLAAL